MGCYIKITEMYTGAVPLPDAYADVLSQLMKKSDRIHWKATRYDDLLPSPPPVLLILVI